MIRSNVGFLPGSPDAPRVRHDTVERMGGEFVPDAPWDFPPGAPGTNSGPEVPESFARWLESHDDRMVISWQPVTEVHVVWRYGADGEPKCVMPCVNPFDFQWADLEPGQPVPLDNRMKALLLDSDPRSYGGEKQMLQYAMGRLDQNEQRKLDRTLEVMRDARERARQPFKPMVGSGSTISGKKVHKAYK